MMDVKKTQEGADRILRPIPHPPQPLLLWGSGSILGLPGLTQHVLAALHFDSRHRQVCGVELGHLQLLQDSVEGSGTESLLQVLEMLFHGLGHQDHKAQVVGQLQAAHLERKRCSLSVLLPRALPAPALWDPRLVSHPNCFSKDPELGSQALPRDGVARQANSAGLTLCW